MTSDSDSELKTDDPKTRLGQLLQANACIVYHEKIPDREFPQVTCSVYGAPKTNELFVRIDNGKVSYVGVVDSPLAYPAMADRIFGLDVLDHEVAFGLAEQLWEKHKTELVSQ